MSKISKKLIVLIIIILSLAVLYFGTPRVYWYYQSWKIGQLYRELEKGFIEYLKKDVYGGKTPQETYEMYVKSLKTGNLELASKYYWWEKQVKEKQRLERLKEEGKLKDYIDSLPEWSEMKEEEYWDKDGRKFIKIKVYTKPHIVKLPIPDSEGKTEILVPPGESIIFSLTFQLNKQANIWKLY